MLASALCCWSAHQQSPPTSPVSPCSGQQSAATCTCSPSLDPNQNTVTTHSNPHTATAPSTDSSAATKGQQQHCCYHHHHHHHHHNHLDEKQPVNGSSNSNSSEKGVDHPLPLNSEKDAIERHSLSSARNSTSEVIPRPPSPTRQQQLLNHHHHRRQSNHGSLSSTSSSRSNYLRGFLSSSKSTSSPSSTNHHDHLHQQQHAHSQLQSSPGKSPSKKFSLQKFYYPRSTMTATANAAPPTSSSGASSFSSPTAIAAAAAAATRSNSASFSRMDTRPSSGGPLAPLAFEGPRTLGLLQTTGGVTAIPSETTPSTPPPLPSILQPPLLSLTVVSEAATVASYPVALALSSPDYNMTPAPLLTPSPSLTLPAQPMSIPTTGASSLTTKLVLPLTPASPPSLSVSPSSPPPSSLSLHPFSLSTLSTSYSSSSSSSSSLSASSSPNTSPSNSPTETSSKSLISSPLQSELTPYPACSISPANLAALIERGESNKQGVSAGPRPLVLDLRPNPDFDPISIVHSININLPTLLMRRYRRGGAVTSFALESFITMPSDKDLYHLIQDGWRQDQDQRQRQCGSAEVAHDVVVLDQDMKAGSEEYGRSPSPAWTLVNVLERGGGNCGGQIRLWYLDGGFEAFQAWDLAEKFLIRPGSVFEMNTAQHQHQHHHDVEMTLAPEEGSVHPHSMPLSLPSSSTSSTFTDAKTAQAIDHAVSLTNASLGATPRQRGAPARRESLFSLNTKSLQRPAGLSRAQTIGVSALNLKPLTIPPINTTLQPLQEGGAAAGAQPNGLAHPLPPLRHKGSWLTVPTGGVPAPALSPAMSVHSSSMDLAQSASTDHTSTWSATSGGSNHGDNQQQYPLGSKKSFSSTTLGIQEEEDEESGGAAGSMHRFPSGSSSSRSTGLRRHHNGADAYGQFPPPTPSSLYFDTNQVQANGNSHVNRSNSSASSGFHQEYQSRMFADGIDSYTNNSSSPYHSSNILLNHHQQGGYDDDYCAEEGGDDGEQEISCILPNFLYLGPEIVTEEQVQELERLGIRRVLNMARECEDLLVLERPGIEYQKIGVQDHVEADVSAGLMQAVDVISASTESPIYVHCKAGKSRSVTAIIAYLITQLHWSLNKAYNHVLTQRPCMCPNIGFVTELMRMEERTLGQERAGGLARAGSLNSILSLSTAGTGSGHHHHHHSLQHTHSLSMSAAGGPGSPTKMLSTKSSMASLAMLSPPPAFQQSRFLAEDGQIGAGGTFGQQHLPF